MEKLLVFLHYSSTEYAPNTARHRSPVALPLRVLDVDGSLIAEGVASATVPATFDLPGVEGLVFVRLKWPSGKTQTLRAKVQEGSTVEVHFDDTFISLNEWSAWAVPRLNKRTALAQPGAAKRTEKGIDRFNRVWLRMWNFKNGQWVVSTVSASAAYRNDAAQQLDFELAEGGWLLQFGGATVPWRFVSLPGGGPCRVLLTPTDSRDPRAEPLKAIVTGFRADAEMLMEFLTRDAIRAATSLADFHPLATRLLADKIDDAVSAVAGAYFLLRTERWRTIPTYWFDNLNAISPRIADTAIIRCVVRIRQGLTASNDQQQAFENLKECLARGVPLFAEGLSLLQEASSLLRNFTKPPMDGSFDRVESLATSQAWAGAALSFYGEAPDLPSPVKRLGLPESSRATSEGVSRAPADTAFIASGDKRTIIASSISRQSRRKSLMIEGGLVFLGDLKT